MFSSEDIIRFREDTEGVNHVIHLNNAGASLPPNPVRRRVVEYLEEEMTLGGYETHTKYFEEIEGTYGSIARLINADESEIALVENATVAWNAGFQAIDWKDGDVILVTTADYASNYLSYLHLQRKVNVKIEVIPNDEFGQPDIGALPLMLNEQVKMVSVTHMPTNSGLLVDAEGIGAVVREHPCIYLLDACQTVGQYPLDVERIGCDLLSATGRKYLRGPRGTGFLFASNNILDQLTPAWIDLHSAEWTGKNEYIIRSDARKFENWEGNRAGTVGLKTAVDYILEIGINNIWERILELGAYTRKRLAEIDGVTLRDIGKVKGGIVSFTVAGKTAEEVKVYLHSKGINVSWNGRANTFLDMSDRGLDEIVRACVHYYNTKEEVNIFCKALSEI